MTSAMQSAMTRAMTSVMTNTMTSALTSVRPSAHSVLLCTLEFFSLPSPVVDNQQRNIHRTLQSPSVSDDVEDMDRDGDEEEGEGN